MSDKIKQILLMTFFVISGLGTIFVIYNYLENFTQFGAAILLVAIATILLFLIDKYLLYGFDTLNELKKNNIAVGLGLIAYAIIIGFSLLSAFK